MDKSYKRAIIEIENHEVEEVKEEEKKSSSAELGGKKSLSNVTEKISAAGAGMASFDKPLTADAISGAAKNQGDGSEKKQFPVQFNPVNLKLTAIGKKSRPKTGADEKHKTIDYGMLGVSMIVTIPLIFDKSDIWELSQNTEKENQAKDKSVKKNTIKKSVSVAENVAEFINAMENPNTRNIRFSWGSLIYEGILSELSTEYTMFSEQGEPLRANVSLRLLCKNKEGMEYWKEKCEENFEEE